MSVSLSRFELHQPPELEHTLRTMERMIEQRITKTLDDGTIVPADGMQWDVLRHPAGARQIGPEGDSFERSDLLLQASRYLTFTRSVGRGTLMVARALGSPYEEPRERLFGIRTKNTTLDWYSTETAIDDDVVCTRFGIRRKGDLRAIAAGLLDCLERAKPIEAEAPQDMSAAQPVAVIPFEMTSVIVPPQRRESAAFRFRSSFNW